MQGSSTEPRALAEGEERRHRWIRRAGLAAFTAFVLAGLSGALGVRTATTTVEGATVRVSLRHAVVTRPALAVPYRLTVTRTGGFDDRIEVRITSRYLESFDENGTQPAPAVASADGDETIWTFDRPAGDTLMVWLDTRVEPGVQWRREGTTTVSTGGEVLTLDHPLWVLP